MARHKSKRLILVLLLCGAFLAAVLIGFGFWHGWFGKSADRLSIGLPGSASNAALDFKMDPKVAQQIEGRMLDLLYSDKGYGLAGWYQLAGRLGQPAAVLATTFSATDQLRYGLYLLEQSEQKAFLAWWDDFRANYRTGQGVIMNSPAGFQATVSRTDDFWRNNLSALRLLAQSCQVWPGKQRQADLEQLSSQLLSQAEKGFTNDFSAAVPTAAPTLDPAATPTPKPLTPAPDDDAKGQNLSVLRLATPDLYAMQQLAKLDKRWQTLFDLYLPIVKGGYLSDALPLYALGHDAEQPGYLSFSGNLPAIDTEEALLAILHLCEIGQENARSLSWIKDQIYNQHALYTSYHITQGSPASEEECLPAYAIVARIARIKGDLDLYRAAVDRMLWHQATSQTSEARYALFRQNEAGQVKVFASDNTWALLAVR